MLTSSLSILAIISSWLPFLLVVSASILTVLTLYLLLISSSNFSVPSPKLVKDFSIQLGQVSGLLMVYPQ